MRWTGFTADVTCRVGTALVPELLRGGELVFIGCADTVLACGMTDDIRAGWTLPATV